MYIFKIVKEPIVLIMYTDNLTVFVPDTSSVAHDRNLLKTECPPHLRGSAFILLCRAIST